MAPSVLAVSEDLAVLDRVLVLCGALGAELLTASDPSSARWAWPGAAAVVVGGDVARAAVASTAVLPRREGVVVAATDPPDELVWRGAVRLGAERVLSLDDGDALADLLAAAVASTVTAGPVVGVVGGRGGAGATTLAAALVVTAARGGRHTCLVDLDAWGAGADLVLGAEDVPGMRWPDLARAADPGVGVSGAALVEALPVADGVAVLSFGAVPLAPVAALDAALVGSVLGAVRRTVGLTVVDVPRHDDRVTPTALGALDVCLLVVPADLRSCAAAASTAAALGAAVPDLRLVVRGPAPGGLPPEAVADALGLPLAASMGAEPGLDRALERGEPPGSRTRGPLARACAELLGAVTSVPGRGGARASRRRAAGAGS